MSLTEDPFSQLSTIPMDEFPLKWRFTDLQYDLLPQIHVAQVLPLTPDGANRLQEMIWNSGIYPGQPFRQGYFRDVASAEVGDRTDAAENRRVSRWLYDCGVPFQTAVFLSYDNIFAIKTTWKMLIKYWSAFYYPVSDDITVVDRSLQWAVCFSHEGQIIFGTNSEGFATSHAESNRVRVSPSRHKWTQA